MCTGKRTVRAWRRVPDTCPRPETETHTLPRGRADGTTERGIPRCEVSYAEKMQAERSQKKMLAMAAVFAASVSYAHAQAAGGYTYIAGYEPRSTVEQHANIDKDVRDIISALPSNNGGALSNCDGNNCKWHADTSDLVSSHLYPTIFDTACAHSGATVSTTDQCLSPYGIWKYGKYSLKSTSVRSIGTGFGMGLKNGKSSNNGVADVASGDNPFIGRMNTYWAGKGLDRQGWGYDIVEAAFKGTSLANNVFNFATVGMDFRKQVIQKGLIYLNIFPYVIWEMQDAVNDCNDGDLTSNDAPLGGASVHAWDEAVAFYTGSLEGTNEGGNNDLLSCSDGNCELLFQLADYRCKNYGTCTADSDGNAFSGYSKLNKDIFKLFQRGEGEVTAAHAASGAARQAQCDAVSSTMEQVGTKMLTMFIQGTLRYLYKTKSTQSSKEAGELFAFAAVALPFIDAVDSNAATLLYNRAFNLDFSGDAAALKTLIEATYPKLGVGSGIGLITCADVGTLHDSNNNVLWDGCKDPSPSSSKNNDTTLGLGIGIPLGAIAITALVFVVFLWRKSSANSKRVEELTMQLRGPGKV